MVDFQKRFEAEIDLRGRDDFYIDKNEEREILQIAIQQGVATETALDDLSSVCDRKDYILESRLMRSIKMACEDAIQKRGHIDRSTFDTIFHQTRTTAKGKQKDAEIRRLIVVVMEDNGLNRVKTGWFNNWYKSMKREAGML
jgi:hypothetical protein